ncbi:class I SAM-dependent methyltransferase [Gordonia westfalica]|uniref:Methyltransferase domain-containing protein n=1 Tax=Gordonia westfalica TaxID=158898 RepID=A0A1H2JEC8_9ACTN|nr:class I SAM-dependent methyltransferase [Gordonia westfalica]SDU54733.1 Methyltransferase domain-containing protein [Gordonia westfalica]
MTNTTSTIDLARVEAFAGQVSADLTHAYHSISVHLGDRLGLWRSLADLGSATSAELAERSGLAPRYVHEWLCVQAAAGYVVLDASSDGGIDTFTLPAEHAMVLADDDSPAAIVAGFEVAAAVWASVDQLAHAYTTGDGIPWHAHDSRLFTGVERFYGTIYRTSLLAEWVPAVDGLSERLTAGIDVLDVGCGLGVPTILLAEAFPKSRFVGVDTHAESVERATAAAIAAGVSDRVEFRVASADDYDGSHDAIVFFDALHDFGDPVAALAHARASLRPGGQVIAVEPFAHDTLADNLTNPVALLFYSGSSYLCVPHSIADGETSLGAQAGPGRLLDAFRAAGLPTARVAATAANLLLEAGV